MGKNQVWSVTAYVFLFLSLASQVHCRSHSNGNRGGVNQQDPKEKDLIKSFPGQPHVSFKQYGGFVPVNETTGRFLYYYFVEAIKASDSAPLVLWFNGGKHFRNLIFSLGKKEIIFFRCILKITCKGFIVNPKSY